MTAWLMLTSVPTHTLTLHTARLSGLKKSWRKLPTGQTESSQCSPEDKTLFERMQFDSGKNSIRGEHRENVSKFGWLYNFRVSLCDVESFRKMLYILYHYYSLQLQTRCCKVSYSKTYTRQEGGSMYVKKGFKKFCSFLGRWQNNFHS